MMTPERALVPLAAGLALGLAAATSLGQVVDGVRDAAYGAPLSVQAARVIDVIVAGPASGSIQTNNSNVLGVGAYLGGDYDGPPEDVLTGLEFVIPVAELNWDGVSPIKITAFINGQGHDYLANQIVGGMDVSFFSPPGNPGEPRNVDFADDLLYPGSQHRTVAAVQSLSGQAIDGVATGYPVPLWVQDVATGFGNNTNPDVHAAGGSEFNALRAYRDDNGTPGNTSDDLIYVHISGNLQTNFNKIDVFFDVRPGGQNILRSDNASVDFNGLNRMGSTTVGNGLRFDEDFAADYYFTMTTGNTPAEVYASSAVIFTNGDPNFGGEGEAGNYLAGGAASAMPYTGTGPNGGSITYFLDNSNVLGISSPGGGTGSDGSPLSSPAMVNTGVEFVINLDQLGYDDNGQVGIAGFLMYSGWDYFSNQVIGGLPANTNSLGSPASDKSFNDSDPNGVPGNQFVTVPVPALPGTVLPALDGVRDASYGPPLWVNANATSFGDNIDAGPNNATGSEIDAVYAQVVRNASNERLLYVLVAGNVGQFHRLVTFFDLKAGEGQNQLRGDNPDIDFNGLNNMEGFRFDAGFAPDFVIGYHLGYNESTMEVEHYFDGAELFTDGSQSSTPVGGRFAGGVKTTEPLSGQLLVREGFGNNTIGGGSTRFDANGSELAAAYARIGTIFDPFGPPVPALYLFFSGNLEPNGNKLEVFFDTQAGNGQSTLIWDDPENPNGYQGNPLFDMPWGGQSHALNRMGGPFPIYLYDEFGQPVLDEFGQPIIIDTLPGLAFDTGFTADHYFSIELSSVDNSPGFPNAVAQALFARLRGALGPSDPGEGRFVGQTLMYSGAEGLFEGGDYGEMELIRAFIDNSNTGGVPGGGSPGIATADIVGPASTANTGIEIAIPLSDLNWDGTSIIRVQAMINGIAHDFVSNQHLQAACTYDLGEPRLVNFNNLDGVQYMELQRVGATAALVNLSPAIGECVDPVEPPACPGDLTGDSVVNADDLGVLLSNFGCTSACTADLNGDGVVNADDLGMLLSGFGTVCE
jgi:hypothetical protein